MFQSLLKFFGLQTIPTALPPDPLGNLKRAFADPRYTWRSIEALHAATGLANVETTRALLASLGARRSEMAKEVYTLPLAVVVSDAPFMGTPNQSSEDKLQAALENSNYTWRSLSALAKIVSLSESDTRSILKGMDGVRAGEIRDGKEAYTLS